MRGGTPTGRRPQDPAEGFVHPAGAGAQCLRPFLTAGSARDARTRLGDALTLTLQSRGWDLHTDGPSLPQHGNGAARCPHPVHKDPEGLEAGLAAQV